MLACLEDAVPLEADAFLRVALRNAHEQLLSLLVQVLAVWTSPETARLVESGLHDTDRYKRASALEALESLSAHRFARFLLPILAADAGGTGLGVPWHTASGSSRTPICARRSKHVCYAPTSGL